MIWKKEVQMRFEELVSSLIWEILVIAMIRYQISEMALVEGKDKNHNLKTYNWRIPIPPKESIYEFVLMLNSERFHQQSKFLMI